MAPRAPKPRTPKPRAPDPPDIDAGRLVLRGLSPADFEALDRETAAARVDVERTVPGASVSRNAVAVGLLREALEARARRRAGPHRPGPDA